MPVMSDPFPSGIVSLPTPVDDADQIVEERALAGQLGQSHVDYFSHALDESDLQKSWRYANKHRDQIFNGRRLEPSVPYLTANPSLLRLARFMMRTVVSGMIPEHGTEHMSKDSDITWLYGPIFLSASDRAAPPLTPISRPPSVLVPSDIHPVRSADSPLVGLSITSSASSVREGATSDGTNLYPASFTASSRPPRAPLKPALKRRDPDDILTVIRREREWLTQGTVDGAPYVASLDETNILSANDPNRLGVGLIDGSKPRSSSTCTPTGLQKSRSSTDFSRGARSRYTSTIPPPATVTPTSAGAPSSTPMTLPPPKTRTSLRRVPSLGTSASGASLSMSGSSPSGAHRVISLASMADAKSMSLPSSSSGGSLAGRRSVSEASIAENAAGAAARHIRFSKRVEQRMIFDGFEGESRSGLTDSNGSRGGLKEGGESSSPQEGNGVVSWGGEHVLYSEPSTPPHSTTGGDSSDEDEGVVISAQPAAHRRRGSVGAGKLLKKSASAQDTVKRGGLVPIKAARAASGPVVGTVSRPIEPAELRGGTDIDGRIEVVDPYDDEDGLGESGPDARGASREDDLEDSEQSDGDEMELTIGGRKRAGLGNLESNRLMGPGTPPSAESTSPPLSFRSHGGQAVVVVREVIPVDAMEAGPNGNSNCVDGDTVVFYTENLSNSPISAEDGQIGGGPGLHSDTSEATTVKSGIVLRYDARTLLLHLEGLMYRLKRLLAIMQRILRRLFGILTGKSRLRRLCAAGLLVDGEAHVDTVVAVETAVSESRVLKPEYERLRKGRMERREVEAVIRAVAEKKGFGDGAGKCVLVLYGGIRVHVDRSRLRSLDDLAATTYNNDKHWGMLVELYTTLLPTLPSPPRFGDHWSAVGFQGKDPVTDFRGMGVLALSDAVYFAREHGDMARRGVGESNVEGSWFPFAATGINVTLFALSCARKGQLQRLFYTYGTTVETYQEFYSYVFAAFLKAWRSEVERTEGKLTVLDFPRVFGDVRAGVERELQDGKGCVLDVAGGARDGGKRDKGREESETTL
ncbi:ELMO domain-containing protein 1 [Gonapodya sp. JEL0774]|nr:ELMO domain-containing protein 1 [Gonapodya sp. JEL0774]